MPMDEKEIQIELDESTEDEDNPEMGFKQERPNPIRFIPIVILIALFGIIIADYYVRDTLKGRITDKVENLESNYTAVIPSLEDMDAQVIALYINTLYTRGMLNSILLPDSSLYNTLTDNFHIPDSIIAINDNIATSIEKQVQNDNILTIATKGENERLIYKNKQEKNIKGFCIPENGSPFITFFKDRWRHLFLVFE